MKTFLKSSSRSIIAVVLLSSAFIAGSSALAADKVLTGTIVAVSGEKMAGATVSAKAEGSAVTWSVFTDAIGDYFMSAIPEGKYKVWAQALGFHRALGTADLSVSNRHDLKLSPITDFETRWRQLPGDEMLAVLPEATPEDARIKNIFRANCGGRHTPNFVLQNKFDEAGWSAIIYLMKVVPVTGIYPGEKAKPNAILHHHQKELAAYLARIRGPGPDVLKIRERPRPSGEAARAVFKEVDLPVNPATGVGAARPVEDGSDWARGAPTKTGVFSHDSLFDLAGNVWFTVNSANPDASIGRVDAKTSEVSFLKVPGPNNVAATAHGVIRDRNGNIWFDVNYISGRRSLAKLDPKTSQIEVYVTPPNMSPLGGAVTIDMDGKGMIWASAPDGALRFDPESLKFTEFKSVRFKTAKGNGVTYGVAGDCDGNGWWAQMPLDTIGFSDISTGKSGEVQFDPVAKVVEAQSPELRKFYDGFEQLSFNSPLPWQHGPRRMGADKNADVVWTGNSWSGTLARIDTKTKQVSYVPTPESGAQQPYHLIVDTKSNVWWNFWTADTIGRYDPVAAKWTVFDLPRRATEIRHIYVDEQDGRQKVVVPVYRTGQIAVMTVRTEQDMAALKAQAAR